jgi:plastocyanin
MSNTGWAVAVIVLILILGGGWWYYSTQMPAPAATDSTVQTGDTNTQGGAGDTTGGAGVGVDVGIGDASTRVEVRYTANGFEPSTITVARGTAVTFINDTAGRMWVGADEHPTHAEYDGSTRDAHCSGSYTGATPFDQCQAGSTYTFVFSRQVRLTTTTTLRHSTRVRLLSSNS